MSQEVDEGSDPPKEACIGGGGVPTIPYPLK